MRNRSRLAAGTLLVLGGLGAGSAAGLRGSGLDLGWFTVDGGGSASSSAGGLEVRGSIGQPDAGELAGGTLTLLGGFQGGGGAVATGAPGVPSGDPVASGPLAFAMHAPRPNPFRPSTTLAFDLPERRSVHLVIHDIAGRRVRTLARGLFDPGRHAVRWDGRDDHGSVVASGVYLVSLRAGPDVARSKIVRLQ